MSSRSYLYACTSREEAETQNFLDNHCWIMKWKMPIFWYACFEPEDVIQVQLEDITFPAFLASAQTILERLEQRRAGTLNLIPSEIRAPYGDLYDAFVSRIREDFSDFILLDYSDFLALMEWDPQGVEAWVNEIADFASIFDGNRDLTLEDFPITGAFDIGAPLAPFQMEQMSANDIAVDWRFMTAGGPASVEDFPPPPTDIERGHAQEVLNEFIEQQDNKTEEVVPTKPRASKKPWWKLW